MPRKPQDKSEKRRMKSSGFLVRFNELYAGSRFCISARSEGRKETHCCMSSSRRILILIPKEQPFPTAGPRGLPVSANQRSNVRLMQVNRHSDPPDAQVNHFHKH